MERLLHNRSELTPYVLDPSLKMYEDLYAAGNAEAVGFLPNAELKAKRKNAIKKQKAQVKEGDKVSQKSSRVESKKRANQDSSASSTASTSTDRRGGQVSGQTGGRLTYENKHQNPIRENCKTPPLGTFS